MIITIDTMNGTVEVTGDGLKRVNRVDLKATFDNGKWFLDLRTVGGIKQVFPQNITEVTNCITGEKNVMHNA